MSEPEKLRLAIVGQPESVELVKDELTVMHGFDEIKPLKDVNIFDANEMLRSAGTFEPFKKAVEKVRSDRVLTTAIKSIVIARFFAGFLGGKVITAADGKTYSEYASDQEASSIDHYSPNISAVASHGIAHIDTYENIEKQTKKLVENLSKP